MLTACVQDGKIHLRQYCIRKKKAAAAGGEKPLELNECGPSMTLVPRRSMIAAEDLMKQAIKKPAQLKEKKEKNKETNVFGETTGRLHMEKQDLSKLQTRKMKVKLFMIITVSLRTHISICFTGVEEKIRGFCRRGRRGWRR